jgi:CheY-like chemotaxis protein
MTKILIVEDNEMNLDMLSRRLGRAGFEIVSAMDGKKGLAAVRAEAPDLVLLDMSLPEMDGWAVARAIRADPAIAGTRIIALTAHAMASDREEALAAGCDDYDTKPVDLTRLLGKIKAQLDRKEQP